MFVTNHDRASKRLALGLALSAVVLLSACNHMRGLPDRHLRELPDAQELVGTWTIDTASLERMKSSYAALTKTAPEDHLVVLRKDGTCLFKTYWAFQSDSYYANSGGRWKLAMIETVAGSGKQRAAVVITLMPQNAGEVTTEFWIVRENNELILWRYIGDPDHTQYADFRKTR